MRHYGCLCSIFSFHIESAFHPISLCRKLSLDVAQQAFLYKVGASIIPFACFASLISSDHCVCKLVLTLDVYSFLKHIK